MTKLIVFANFLALKYSTNFNDLFEDQRSIILKKYEQECLPLISSLSPENVLEKLESKISNIEKDSFNTPIVRKNISELQDFAFKIESLLETGTRDKIIDLLGSDDLWEGVHISGEWISKLNDLKDEIEASLPGRFGKLITLQYEKFITRLKGLVKRYAENKNKYERGKAFTMDLPENSKSLVQMNLNGVSVLVGFDDFMIYLKTGILPKRILKLSKDIIKQIKDKKLKLLNESDIIEKQNNKLEMLPNQSIIENMEDPAENIDRKDNILKKKIHEKVMEEAVQGNYKKLLQEFIFIKNQLDQAILVKNKLNNDKKEAFKLEGPRSSLLPELTKKYVEALEITKNLDDKLKSIKFKINKIELEYPNLIKGLGK